jgi:hypothetical protein
LRERPDITGTLRDHDRVDPTWAVSPRHSTVTAICAAGSLRYTEASLGGVPTPFASGPARRGSAPSSVRKRADPGRWEMFDDDTGAARCRAAGVIGA